VKNLPKPEKLAELLTMHSFEVKNLEKIRNDWIFDIDVLSNRAHDCLSHIGLARECAALLNSKFKISDFKPKEDKKLKVQDFINVEVRDSELCPRYTARGITDIKVGPSPKWLKDKLEAIGQKSINNIVDATNYLMFEMGQPVHAFDYDKVEGKKIIVRRAKKGEKIVTLEGEKCDLDNDVLVIADSKEPLALAGIKGGKKAEIDNNTTSILLESANFNLHNIHKSSRQLGITTESSLRFEHGLDPNLASEAMNKLAFLIQKIAGGKITKGMIDVCPKKRTSRKIFISLSKINNLLGTNFTQKTIIKIFKSLQLKAKLRKNQYNQFVVEIPTWRLDLEIPEDLIEEVGRIYGYEKIPLKPPIGMLVSSRPDDILKLKKKVKNILEGLGLAETYNYSFVGDDDLKMTGDKAENYLELKNPLSSELKYLRRDLITNLLKNVRENFKYFNEIRLFELGKVYYKCRTQSAKCKINEKMMLAGVVGKKENSPFYEVKGIVDGLLNKLGISNQWYDDFQATPENTEKKIWYPGRSAEIKIDDKEIGYLGEINPQILSEFGIKDQVAAFNIDFESLIRFVSEELIYTSPSKYPAVVRDIAILINLGDRTSDVLNVINSAGGKLIRDVDLFDMYEGRELPQGKKNLAFHVVYQSDERTLTDKEVDKIHKKIIRALEKKTGWRVRK